MSGYTDETIFHRGVFAPGTHFISKPFNPAQLTRMVLKALDGETPSNPPSHEPHLDPLSG